jgi:glycogen debranching enzyme
MRLSFLLRLAFVLGLPLAAAAQTTSASQPLLALSTTATEPVRFVAVHGRNSAVMGYGAPGLDVWAYPFQIASHYAVNFLPQGALEPIPGNAILRRIAYTPDAVIRTYIGPNFVVREHLFVPLDQPGAILTYEVEGRQPVDIRVSFVPVMNLMWPGAVGGQGVNWSDDLHGYIVSEESYHTTAAIASPEVVAHTEVGNPTLRQSLAQSMLLHPAVVAGGVARAQLFFGLDQPGTAGGTTVHLLEKQAAGLEDKARQHYATLIRTDTLQVQTPDEQVNRAIAWSEIALDQAWVCNPQLGCGIVAGYGPSRGMRRPQYDWFFAGDGLVAVRGLLAAGEYDRARAELAFILKYQNPKNGMIWHELSQSAGFLDWAGKYPYMFVHVDITFDFLSGVGQYFQASGDRAFVEQNWPALTRAYQYCLSVIDPGTGLPSIPPGKEGADEQVRMRDSTGLSSAWLSAAGAYAALARAAGHVAQAQDAIAAAARARHALAASVWDAKTNLWLAGHTVTGAPIATLHGGPPALLSQDVLSKPELDTALDRLASSSFQTDWGMRSMSSDSPSFTPDSYAQGSVSALATADMAEAFWQQHRPQAAWQMWQALLPWFDLDSLGHMHEVLTGDFFHQQEESVPEQTWSSAGFLDASVHGLLGLSINAEARRVTLAPHLPPQWDTVLISNIRLPGSVVAVQMNQSDGEMKLSLNNQGKAFDLTFAPEIPLGASNLHAAFDNRDIATELEQHGNEEQAHFILHVPPGESHCRLLYSGGVAILMPRDTVQPGDRSIGLRLTGVHLDGHTLNLRAEVRDATHASIELRTPWKIDSVQGGAATSLTNGLTKITFLGAAGAGNSFVTVHAQIMFVKGEAAPGDGAFGKGAHRAIAQSR